MTLAGISVFSAGFYLVTGILMRRWLAVPRKLASPVPPRQWEPITFFRPLKTGEAHLEKHLASFLSSLETGDQVIFSSTDAGTLQLCRELAARYSGLEIICVAAVEGIHRNPKINKLAQMEGFATRQRWMVLDSDAMADRLFLEDFRREWQSSEADGISAPYAFQRAHGWVSRMDALGTSLALWPGVAFLQFVGRLDFLTGACMGVKASLLQQSGGWKILGESLADDHELGLLLSRAGGKIAMSTTVLLLAAPALTWKQWLLHQHRAFVTFRLCNSSGCAGIPLTHGVGISFACLLFHPGSLALWLLHATLFYLRLKSARFLPGIPGKPCDLWLVSLLEPLFWLAAWLPLPVRWGRAWIRPKKFEG